MEPFTPIIIGAVASFLGGFILYRIKTQDSKISSQDRKIDKLTDVVTKLESTAVSDSHVRAVVNECIQPLQSLMEKIDNGMNGIKEYIAEEKGFKRAQIEARRRKEDIE